MRTFLPALTMSRAESIFAHVMRKNSISRTVLCLAAAAGMLFTAGCSKTENGSVLYCIEVRDNGSEEFFGSAASEVKPVSLEIGDKLDTFSDKFSQTWTADAADRSAALERYDNALSGFKQIESEGKAKINALPSGLHDTFSYKKTLVLTSTVEATGEEILKSYSITLSYPSK